MTYLLASSLEPTRQWQPMTGGEWIALAFCIGLVLGIVGARLLWFDVLDEIRKRTEKKS